MSQEIYFLADTRQTERFVSQPGRSQYIELIPSRSHFGIKSENRLPSASGFLTSKPRLRAPRVHNLGFEAHNLRTVELFNDQQSFGKSSIATNGEINR